MTPAHYRNLKAVLDTGKYEVNVKEGYIINLTSGNKLTEYVDKYKTVRMWLTAYGERFSYALCHIVAVAAGHNLTGKTVIHKDGNKLNNAIDNLEIQ